MDAVFAGDRGIGVSGLRRHAIASGGGIGDVLPVATSEARLPLIKRCWGVVGCVGDVGVGGVFYDFGGDECRRVGLTHKVGELGDLSVVALLDGEVYVAMERC